VASDAPCETTLALRPTPPRPMPPPTGPVAPATSPPASVGAALSNCTRDLWLLVDAQSRILWCNLAVERLLRRTLAELAGTAWPVVFPTAAEAGQPLQQAAERLASLRPDQAFDPVEVEVLLADTRTVRLRIAAHSAPGDEPVPGAPGRWLIELQDVTEARLREREARRLSELLDMAQEFGRIGVWEREIPSGVGRWDHHVFSFWGLDPAQGTPSFEDAIAHIHPEDRARMSYRTTTQRAGRYTQRYRVLHADGSTRWIQSQWEVKNGLTGEPARAIGIMMDDSDVYELARSLGDTSAQLKLAIELGNIAIWRHDLKTGRVHYNDRAHQVMQVPASADGLSLEEMRARVHPDDVSQVAAASELGLLQDRPVDIEARFTAGDGTWRTLLTRRVIERDEDGAPCAWVGIALDVTEQAEERRRTSEAMRRLETAAAAAGVGIWSYDAATDVAQWNEPMFELVGRSPAQGAPNLKEWYEQVIHAADRARMRAARELLDQRLDVPGEQQFRVVLPGGQIRWLENRVRREVRDAHPMIFGVTLDITARHNAEDALRNADERAAVAARGAGIGTWELDLLSEEERWDEQMFRLRGLEPQPRPPSRADRLALVHPDDKAALLDSHPDEAAEALPTQYEFRVRWPDGTYRWLASRSIVVQDAAGRAVRRVGVNWDISENKLAEAALRESALAQRESQAKSRFLSRVSHELRTPLNAVLGFTQLLQGERSIEPGHQIRLGWIQSAAEHLLLLINDLLDLSSLEIGDLKVARQPVDLAWLVRESLPLVEPLARQHGVELAAGATEGVALADATRLRQVLINLLTNGIKYNHRRGRVTVTATRSGGHVTLQVTDSGRGLTPEKLAHLFEPFNRLGAEREGIEGSGIGLVIVKALVERMGGTVTVSSQPDQGTCLSVELPAADEVRAQAPEAAQPVPRPSPPASAGRLLYIEDNPVNMLLVEELIALRPGLEMVAAVTGAEGVQLAIERRPGLVLVDMQLPDFDGFEVLRRLRADHRTESLRCVALSANALPEDIARARAAGFADYWTKPIHFGRFLAALDAAFASDLAPVD